jgi:hypothetical protein
MTPFGLVSLKDPSISSDHTPIKSHCDPDAFPTFLTSANPQQSDTRRSRTGRSEIGAQQKGDIHYVLFCRFYSAQTTPSSIKACIVVASRTEYSFSLFPPSEQGFRLLFRLLLSSLVFSHFPATAGWHHRKPPRFPIQAVFSVLPERRTRSNPPTLSQRTQGAILCLCCVHRGGLAYHQTEPDRGKPTIH